MPESDRKRLQSQLVNRIDIKRNVDSKGKVRYNFSPFKLVLNDELRMEAFDNATDTPRRKLSDQKG